jgi:hypothetical protein
MPLLFKAAWTCFTFSLDMLPALALRALPSLPRSLCMLLPRSVCMLPDDDPRWLLLPVADGSFDFGDSLPLFEDPAPLEPPVCVHACGAITNTAPLSTRLDKTCVFFMFSPFRLELFRPPRPLEEEQPLCHYGDEPDEIRIPALFFFPAADRPKTGNCPAVAQSKNETDMPTESRELLFTGTKRPSQEARQHSCSSHARDISTRRAEAHDRRVDIGRFGPAMPRGPSGGGRSRI